MGLLALTVCLIYLFKYINTKFFDTYCKKIIMLSLILYGTIASGANIYVKYHYIKINSSDEKTVLYAFKRVAIPYNNTIDWIIKNTNQNDTVLVLPEGLFINYITKRPTNPKYYHLIPNHISALGEDNIVEDLSKNLPDYFVLNNASYIAYGAEYICKDFGYKICKLIDDNYNLVQIFNSPKTTENITPFKMAIFELKNK